jgi:hypothetical protein
MMRTRFFALAACAVLAAAVPAAAQFEPGARVPLDAHNCYPYDGRWTDRIDRALATGTPLAIEQDLVWFRDPVTGVGRSLVAHDQPGKPALGLTGEEPTLEQYFFERIRPIVEQALRDNRRETWPIITLNLDFKTEEFEHLAAAWAVIAKYRSWLTTAPRAAGIGDVQPLTTGPVLVLTGESDAQRQVFHDSLAAGERLLIFGAARPHRQTSGAGASERSTDTVPQIAAGTRTNYHRWWNNPWGVVEAGGQRKAGPWTAEDDQRLRRLVGSAHDAGLWIRFYTLDGYDHIEDGDGSSPGYNFGSVVAARERWRAAVAAGVDFVATDQYEAFSAELRAVRR